MAVTIDATPGGISSNSYCTLAEAEAYHETRLYNTDWTTATDANKNIVLVWATRLLDEWVDWQGEKRDEDQALRWPRYNVLDRDGYEFDYDSIPQFLKDAVAEQAVYLLATDVTAAPDTQGFSQIQVGDLKLVVDKLDRDKIGVIAESVESIVGAYGDVQSRGGGRTITLVRA